VPVHVLVLHQRNRLKSAAHRDLHAIVDNLLCCGGDGHQTGRALPVHRHAGHTVWPAGRKRTLTRQIEALRALLQRCAHHNVVDLGWRDVDALHCLGDDMPAQRLRLGVVECSAIGSPDRGACGGNATALRIDISPSEFVMCSVDEERRWRPAVEGQRQGRMQH
jgi:hypothetical protein